MSALMVALLGGFAGSFHCVGMCGGFACGLSQLHTGNKRQLTLKMLSYNTGRLVSYTFIGALAGSLGAVLVGISIGEVGVGMSSAAMTEHDGSAQGMAEHSMGGLLIGNLGLVQRILSVAAGALMILMSLQLLGIRRHSPATWAELGGVSMARGMHSLIRSNRTTASVALGVVNGFLPCPLVYAFAAVAAASADVGQGVLIMFAFGLGTFPAMLFMSSVGALLPTSLRQNGVRVAGSLVLLLGLLTIVRGLLPGMLHGATHAMPVM